MEIVDSKPLIQTSSEDVIVGTLYVVEEFVDPEYRLDKVTDNCLWFFDLVKKETTIHSGQTIILDKPKGRQVGQLNQIPVSFREIVGIAERHGKSEPAATQWLRAIWKNGKVRRFYKGYWQGAMLGWVTGTKYGVSYLWKTSTES